ncbi:Flavanone 3-dioxygenase [Bertholletia excelsa]
MASAMSLAAEANGEEQEVVEREYYKGVRRLCESGITKIPTKYVLPVRPAGHFPQCQQLYYPVAGYRFRSASLVLHSLSRASQEFGFFQVGVKWQKVHAFNYFSEELHGQPSGKGKGLSPQVGKNHGVESNIILSMIDASRRFFELPFDERSKYMRTDMRSPVRCGTSFNQNTEGCHPLSEVIPLRPSSPFDLREAAVNYSEQVKLLYLMLIEAILKIRLMEDDDDRVSNLKEFEDGSQLAVANCYPSCPEACRLTPTMACLLFSSKMKLKASRFSIRTNGSQLNPVLTLLSMLIFSNGRYKSVVHRVVVNSANSRISMASLHSRPFESLISPSPKLINEANTRRCKDTDFAAFLQYISSSQHSSKNYLQSRKLLP